MGTANIDAKSEINYRKINSSVRKPNTQRNITTKCS